MNITKTFDWVDSKLRHDIAHLLQQNAGSVITAAPASAATEYMKRGQASKVGTTGKSPHTSVPSGRRCR